MRKTVPLPFSAEELATDPGGMHRAYSPPTALEASLAVIRLANALPGQSKHLTLASAIPLRLAFEQLVRAAGDDQAALDVSVSATITRLCGEHEGGYFPGAKAIKSAMQPEIDRFNHNRRVAESKARARGEGAAP